MTSHLSPERLLRYVDSELSKYSIRKATKHFQTCHSCAQELDRLKQHLAAIAQTEVEIFERSLPPPPNSWPRLEPRLNAVALTSKAPGRNIWSLPFAYGSALVIVVLIALLVWGPVQPVSAKEVLRRATTADSARLAITSQQVVRQRVRVTGKARLASSARSARLESWKSTKSAYWQTGGDPLNDDLRNRYQKNGLASDLPLSPPALESWVKLAGSEPTASRNGGNIEIQVASNAEGRAHGLEQFSFRVQTRDWHVDEMSLAFDDATFQIDEENSSIFERNEVPSDVLARLEPSEPKSTRPPMHAPSAPRNVPPAVNLDDLEVAVRYDLHQMGADLGDSIEITPHAPGELVVNAWGISPQRKAQLTTLLANKPAIELEFQPPMDDRRSPTRAITPVPPSSSQQDNRLMTFFGGPDAEENYTRGVLQASTDVLAHLYALHELAVRWPPGQDSDLSPNAKTQLAAIVRDHARSIQTSVSELESQIDFLLKGLGYHATSETPAPAAAGANWQEASTSALEKARTSDHILRSLLTLSETPMSVSEALPKLKQSTQELETGAHELLASAK